MGVCIGKKVKKEIKLDYDGDDETSEKSIMIVDFGKTISSWKSRSTLRAKSMSRHPLTPEEKALKLKLAGLILRAEFHNKRLKLFQKKY